MRKQDIILTQSRAVIGDAALKLFRIGQTEPPAKTGGKKLLHMHVYYECHLLMTGEANFAIGDRTVHLCERQMLIIPPRQDHQPFDSDSGQRGAAARVFGLTLESTEGEVRCYPYFLAALQLAACTPITLPERLYCRLLAYLDGFDERGAGLRMQCRQLTDIYPLLYDLFDTINGFEMPQYTEHEKRDADPMVTLDWMINEPSYSLEDIAHMLGYSYRHTARKIKEIYGDSLTNIRRDQMLSSAKTLLLGEPDMTLENVARQSGFSGTLAMLRAFRAVEHITPTEYRNQHLYENNGESMT